MASARAAERETAAARETAAGICEVSQRQRGRRRRELWFLDNKLRLKKSAIVDGKSYAVSL